MEEEEEEEKGKGKLMICFVLCRELVLSDPGEGGGTCGGEVQM